MTLLLDLLVIKITDTNNLFKNSTHQNNFAHLEEEDDAIDMLVNVAKNNNFVEFNKIVQQYP